MPLPFWNGLGEVDMLSTSAGTLTRVEERWPFSPREMLLSNTTITTVTSCRITTRYSFLNLRIKGVERSSTRRKVAQEKVQEFSTDKFR
jgi:hypothetical protein